MHRIAKFRKVPVADDMIRMTRAQHGCQSSCCRPESRRRTRFAKLSQVNSSSTLPPFRRQAIQVASPEVV